MTTKESILTSAFFITFDGNCKKALTFYQNCFGGMLYFDTFGQPLPGMDESPVVSASLVSEKFTILASDLVSEKGRIPGNYIGIYIHCATLSEREDYLTELVGQSNIPENDATQKLVEITDSFAVRWVFGI